MIFFWWLKFRKRLNMTWWFAAALTFSQLLIGVLTMKLWAVIEVGGNMEKAANMRLYGAVFIMPLLFYIGAKITKRNTATVMDAFLVGAVISLAFGRLNCLTLECCQGCPVFPGADFRWPIRELEILYYVVFVCYYARKVLRNKTHGQLYPVLLISYGALRFVFEFAREEYTGQIGIFHLAHIWSLISIAAGIIAYYFVEKNNGSGASRRKKAGVKASAKKGGKENGSTA